MIYPKIKLKKGKEISLLRKHAWVFSGAINNTDILNTINDGDLVDVWSCDNIFLGKGHYQSNASIAIRVITFVQKDINSDFWLQKFTEAISYRSCVNISDKVTNCYRLIHGEGDGLPGLVVDIYNDIAVIQCHSLGMFHAINDISNAISHCYFGVIEHIFVKIKDTLPDVRGFSNTDYFTLGHQEETIITENGIKFKINVRSGQKTGFFLDQRENRALVGVYAKDKSILNCFCYTGGFSLYALAGGASSVDSIDISQKAIELLEENIKLNGFEQVHTSYSDNVLTFLASHEALQYDIVIVDPPAFAKSQHKRHNAVQAYKRLNVLALKRVKSGGLLFTFSCSQVVGVQLFYDTIVAAGIESNREIRVVKALSQGPDHPTGLFHPEGHYLKGLLLYVL